MQAVIPKPLEELIEAFRVLPGIGPRSAERYAYFLLKNESSKARLLADTLKDLHKKVKYCQKTFALIDAKDDVSPLYSDSKRDKKLVAVVADPFDILAIEKTNSFKGTYHVLGGLISPIDNVSPDNLHIKELAKRIDQDGVQEIILATNASVEGESTALYVTKVVEKKSIKITRLARGLPAGLDIEYADQITLTRALEGRQAF